jgi:hypothetical protein
MWRSVQVSHENQLRDRDQPALTLSQIKILINGQYKQRNIQQQNNILFVHKKDIAFLIGSSKIIFIVDTFPKNYLGQLGAPDQITVSPASNL